MADETNREKVERLEKTLNDRIRETGAEGMFITTKEAEDFVAYCGALKREANELYEEIEKKMTPEVREKLASIWTREDRLTAILCYAPESVKPKLDAAYKETVKAQSREKDAFYVLRTLVSFVNTT